ncbi:MAG: hypothetical protein J6333_11235 [Planctomycetes bacterium]|nr:hypothetical protein [Planctomycetota bacterium]
MVHLRFCFCLQKILRSAAAGASKRPPGGQAMKNAGRVAPPGVSVGSFESVVDNWWSRRQAPH